VQQHASGLADTAKQKAAHLPSRVPGWRSDHKHPVGSQTDTTSLPVHE
jgi:hypothetical protein